MSFKSLVDGVHLIWSDGWSRLSYMIYGLFSINGAQAAVNVSSSPIVHDFAGKIPVDSLWYQLFPALCEAGSLTILDGKFFLWGVSLSDLIALGVGIASACIFFARSIADFLWIKHIHKITRIESELLEDSLDED